MKKLIVALMIVSMAFSAAAQKLPNVQTASVRAPANIKVDGKATEWGDKLQAYNKATGIFYNMANDDDNIYLVVQAANQEIIHKIVAGGIVLSVNTSAKSLDKGTATITFPAYGDKLSNMFFVVKDKPKATADTGKNKMQLDSFFKAKNLSLTQHLKLIKQTGIKVLPDSLISVYNEDGIKAAAYLDHNYVYSYELAIPLKYLNISVNGPAKFYYNVKLNGSAYYAVKVIELREGIFSILGADGKYYGYGADPAGTALLFPTDFWGEYTLAKKP